MRRTGIRDVAKAADVSVTTVSHALSETHAARVNEQTRTHVQAVANRLGYSPNKMASGLRSQRSNVLGLLSDEIATTPFAGEMIQGAQDAAYDRGWLVMILDSSMDIELEKHQISTLLQHQIDGLVYARMFHQEVVVPEALDKTPVILLDAIAEGASCSSVVPDEEAAAATATNALIAAGHKKIAFINNRDDIPATHARLHGFEHSMRANGLEVDSMLVATASAETTGGREAALELLSSPDRPTAILAFNDRMAMGVYQGAAALGLQIPRDLSVIGIDNLELIAEGLWPGLSTVALPHYEMGSWAVGRLLDEIEGKADPAPVHMKLACPLVERGSIAPPALA